MHCRPLISWTIVAIRFVCHKEARQLPSNTQPSVYIHDGTLTAEREQEREREGERDRNDNMQPVRQIPTYAHKNGKFMVQIMKKLKV